MRSVLRLIAAASILIATTPAGAAQAQVNAGDTAWMLMATSLVLLMTIPGLALFYGGLVRTKNMLSMMAQVFAAVCLVSILWVAFGYSLTYTGGSAPGFFGGASKMFLRGVTIESTVATYTNGIEIPEFVFVAFQMMFACVAPALMIGAFAERMRFSALIMFLTLWVTLVYMPIAHMAWYWVGPDALADAARAVTQAPAGEARRMAEAALIAARENAGLFRQWGAIDFAGGLVVHVSAGVAGLVGAVMLGQRHGYGRVSMAPHDLASTLTGGALLWVGWFGFNAGSALRADGIAGLAMLNTIMSAAAAALSWMSVEWATRGKPSLLGMISGALAGLVAITPAAGYASPVGAIGLGFAAGAVCLWFSTSFKERFQYDDSLDVFGVHCVAGVLGSLAVGLLVSPDLGGTGILDYTTRPGQAIVAAYDAGTQLSAQFKAVVVTLLWSAFVTSQLFRLVDTFVGLRPHEQEEDQGLDILDHGERAYN